MEKFQEPAICEALEEYKQIVSKHNLIAAKYFVNYAQKRKPDSNKEKPNGDDVLEAERLKWCSKILLYSSNVPEGISKTQDIITDWDLFSSKHGLDGAAVWGSADERAARWGDIVRGLRDGLQEVGEDAAELDIPGDFSILLKHADALEGHRWHRAKHQQEGIMWFQGFNGYVDAKASVRDSDTLRGYSAYAWGSDRPDLDEFEHVVAGFETGYVPEGGCYMIYGRLTGEEESKWYYYVNMGQFGIEVHDSLVDFLKWYQDVNIASEQEIDYACHGLWDGQSMFF